MTLHLVFMGVSGTGKTAVAVPVAARLGLDFAEGDDFHPEANVAKMSAGTPLTEADRWPWLRSLADWTEQRAEQDRSTAVTCSALRRSYRDVLRGAVRDTCFVHLAGDRDLILERMASRAHFMPASLLDSQLDTLQPLESDEDGVVVDIDQPLDTLVDELVEQLEPRLSR